MADVDFVLKSGEEAIEWMQQPANASAWQGLHAETSWASPYQSHDYCSLWLRYYGHTWEPVLIIARSEGSGLCGLLPLARRGEKIVGMGAQQAEYQGWICTVECCKNFPLRALDLLFEYYPDAHLRLQYIDAGEHGDSLEKELGDRPGVLLKRHARPLLGLENDQPTAALRKKSTRSKHNRLKRLGELSFEADHLKEGVDEQLAQMAALYDFRQGAMNDTCPFQEDATKLSFCRAWLKETSGQLLFYRLLLDGEVIGALLGCVHGDKVSNAVLAYSAALGKHSPGKLVLYMAAQDLSKSGYRYLDLTPGGDPWKERFADRHDEVIEINAWRNSYPVTRLQRQEARLATGRRLLGKLGLTPTAARELLERVRGALLSPRRLLAFVIDMRPQRVAYHIYSTLPQQSDPGSPATAATLEPRKNCIPDLLLFDASVTRSSRQQFFSSALARLERGENCYTFTENGRLLHYGWMASTQSETFFSEVQQHYQYPEAGTVLYDFYTHPISRGRGLYQKCLSYLLQQAGQQGAPGNAPVYVSVMANDGASRHVIEKIGFELVDSIVRWKFFGHFRQTDSGER